MYELPSELPILPLELRQLGVVPFKQAWDAQRALQKELTSGAIPDQLLLCEHPPTVTLGTGAKPENLLVSEQELKARGISLYNIERGGDITYHGPGQLVAYPIIDLNRRKKRDVHWYMRALEEVIIQTVGTFGGVVGRCEGRTGVWTQTPDNVNESDPSARRKIASLGVRISRWCTLHGVALNVRDCRAGFSLMHPCGLHGIEMTSLQDLLGPEFQGSVESVGAVFAEKFAALFRFELSPCSLSWDTLNNSSVSKAHTRVACARA